VLKYDKGEVQSLKGYTLYSYSYPINVGIFIKFINLVIIGKRNTIGIPFKSFIIASM